MTASASELIEALPDGALLIAASGRVLSANRLALDILQTEALGLDATSLIRTPAFAEALAAAAQSLQPVNFDTEFHGRPTRQVSIHVARTGNGSELLVLLRDLTREQAVEKMRSDFVANASHEMRTPLTSILGGIETLKGPARNDPKAQDQFLDMMLGQVHRMKRLIDDLLTLSRIELNAHIRPSAKVRLSDIANLAKANLSAAAAAANVSVEVTGTSGIEVAGDPDELLQVAQNLVENAIKYGSSGGRVDIDFHISGMNGVLSVRDYGKGIAEHHIPRLTERFYRVSAQESRARGGTGLGLAIVKHIVLRHRGKLTIHSVINEGSTFMVSIPLLETKG
jgi:two-component system, OmpR family, phosphate regulon sensor histidine kinase PhoR